ncbi:uncharacterized protein LOC124408155 [Diprion similis]|uniref:uncharacterized protein LOC124408155 n=1 Tax=Diprion similis TaxID=362088 RepID=UPI001EF77B0E|nr:uncharacterized protein LOC124408155 [Diprion similis]
MADGPAPSRQERREGGISSGRLFCLCLCATTNPAQPCSALRFRWLPTDPTSLLSVQRRPTHSLSLSFSPCPPVRDEVLATSLSALITLPTEPLWPLVMPTNRRRRRRRRVSRRCFAYLLFSLISIFVIEPVLPALTTNLSGATDLPASPDLQGSYIENLMKARNMD